MNFEFYVMGEQLNTKNSTLTTDLALIIFAKAPIPGQVKTRLCPPLTPDEAATLQGSLVLDVVERSRAVKKTPPTLTLPFGGGRAGWGWDRLLACAPSREHVFFKILGERHGIRLIDQVGDNVGARMDQAFKTVFALGYRQVVMVGTDIPALPPSSFAQAFNLLTTHDLVLGPALDGGYYLIGLTQPVPELFQGISWSTDQVCALTRSKAEDLGLKTALLPTCRDLDRIEDLRAIVGQPGLSARTAEVLRMLVERLRS